MDKDVDLAREAILNYFATYNLDQEIVFGETRVIKGLKEDYVYDYTGLIGISGDYEGGVYITCRVGLLEAVYKAITKIDPEKPFSEPFSDLIGEMANTLAGYFQKSLQQ